MIMQIRKPEHEGTLLKESWKEKFRKRTEQDWSMFYWKEVEKE